LFGNGGPDIGDIDIDIPDVHTPLNYEMYGNDFYGGENGNVNNFLEVLNAGGSNSNVFCF
jgi:hypothetical protein